jgi:hypothetical protein
MAEKSTGCSFVFCAFASWNEHIKRTKHKAAADFMTFPLRFLGVSSTPHRRGFPPLRRRLTHV